MIWTEFYFRIRSANLHNTKWKTKTNRSRPIKIVFTTDEAREDPLQKCQTIKDWKICNENVKQLEPTCWMYIAPLQKLEIFSGRSISNKDKKTKLLGKCESKMFSKLWKWDEISRIHLAAQVPLAVLFSQCEMQQSDCYFTNVCGVLNYPLTRTIAKHKQ